VAARSPAKAAAITITSPTPIFAPVETGVHTDILSGNIVP